MSELEYCAFCDGGYAHSGICDKCATEIEQTGKELADKDRQLAEARAEIERKNKLIEQMREALERLSNAATAVNQQRHDNPDPAPMFIALGEMLSAIKQADEAIKAAKGEI